MLHYYPRWFVGALMLFAVVLAQVLYVAPTSSALMRMPAGGFVRVPVQEESGDPTGWVALAYDELHTVHAFQVEAWWWKLTPS